MKEKIGTKKINKLLRMWQQKKNGRKEFDGKKRIDGGERNAKR